jgi:hypothetical protein
MMSNVASIRAVRASDPAERVAALAIGRLEQFDPAGIFGDALAGHADLPEGAEEAEAERDPGRAEGETTHDGVFGSARHHERPRHRGVGMFILLGGLLPCAARRRGKDQSVRFTRRREGREVLGGKWRARAAMPSSQQLRRGRGGASGGGSRRETASGD